MKQAIFAKATVKARSAVSSQIYSQSSQNGKSFAKHCNVALYFGPKDQYKRNTKDFDGWIEDHEKEFALLEAEDETADSPKYLVDTEQIVDKYVGEWLDPLVDLYSSQYPGILEDEALRTFVKSELIRISIIYFSNLNGVKVTVSPDHEDLKKNVVSRSLLSEKYQENYSKDLIDSSKTGLITYLYNYLSNDHLESFCDAFDGGK